MPPYFIITVIDYTDFFHLVVKNGRPRRLFGGVIPPSNIYKAAPTSSEHMGPGQGTASKKSP